MAIGQPNQPPPVGVRLGLTLVQTISTQVASGGQMEILRKWSITTLSNSGVQSEQLLFPENSSSRRVTITRVTVQPGAANPPHRHPSSEQIWVALEGGGILLLDGERTEPFGGGDVVRFEDGDLHGFRNSGGVPFVYLSVTSPPVNFREAYSKDWSGHTPRLTYGVTKWVKIPSHWPGT